jgi:AraC-like DNA-binding protein
MAIKSEHCDQPGRRPEPLAGRLIIDTTDIEDAEQAMSTTYLPLRLSARPGGDLKLRLNAITIGRATIGYLRFSTAIRVVTDEAANYHLNIPLSGQSRSRAGNGDEVISAPGSAAVYMPGEPVDLRWTSDTRQRCLMLGKATLERELAHLLGRELRQPLTFFDKIDLRGGGGGAILQTLGLIDQEAQRETGLLHHPLAAQRLEQLLIDGLVFGHEHNYSGSLTTEHPWTTGELSAEVGVSARVLQAGLRRLTGVTPMAYLETVRLQRAHDDLESGDRLHTSVSHIAHHWGFLHVGRFSAAYQRRYGELPSHTLRRGA